MDQLLNKAGSTLVTFAVKSGMQLVSNYMAKGVTAMLDQVPLKDQNKVFKLRKEIENKMQIVSYSIECIQLASVKGESILDNVLQLSNDLNDDFNEFKLDVDKLLSADQATAATKLTSDKVPFLLCYMHNLVKKIDSAIPIISMALSLLKLNTINDLSASVSTNRLINATAAIASSNQLFGKTTKETRVGKPFSVTLYDVFYNHNATGDTSPIVWKEKFPKAQLELVRMEDSVFDYCYKLKLTEDFDDDRYHDDDEVPGTRNFDLRQITRVFFSASAKLLKLEDRSSPVLVLKLNKLTKSELDDRLLNPSNANAGTDNKDDDSQFSWIAIGDFELDVDSDSDSDNQSEAPPITKISSQPSPLSLLEYLIRLCVLQVNSQTSILNANDETLKRYLANENSFQHLAPERVPELSSKLEKLNI